MPAAEAAALAAAYAEAGCVLEYGAGGSTVLAAERPGKTVITVESDADWVARMQAWFAANPPAGEVVLHHADIGPTKDWGHPADQSALRRWPGYALSVWDRKDFRHPDVVLIDGRFRVACLLATAFRITRPVTVLFDDYAGRKHYHGVEEFIRPTALVGRMALFDLVPQPVPADKLGWIIPHFTRPA
ncbi:MAG: hypothetical protein KGI94_11940 [Paracoccaceae bacterium]|nr:hypothetical protein [Paracoccaceae bacterium]MDE3122075.1 hypothetical protein [Paracoccaceae bacterium]MDE3239171.1 hypothetical protein [Paracoccaceae bacterium]